MYLLLKMVVFRCNYLWFLVVLPPPPPHLLEKQLHLLDPNSQAQPTSGEPQDFLPEGNRFATKRIGEQHVFFFVFFWGNTIICLVFFFIWMVKDV